MKAFIETAKIAAAALMLTTCAHSMAFAGSYGGTSSNSTTSSPGTGTDSTIGGQRNVDNPTYGRDMRDSTSSSYGRDMQDDGNDSRNMRDMDNRTGGGDTTGTTTRGTADFNMRQDPR